MGFKEGTRCHGLKYFHNFPAFDQLCSSSTRTPLSLITYFFELLLVGGTTQKQPCCCFCIFYLFPYSAIKQVSA